MGVLRHKEKLIFRSHHQENNPPMHLSSLMPYVFDYQHIYLILMETLPHDFKGDVHQV